jgi:hypothetical protein
MKYLSPTEEEVKQQDKIIKLLIKEMIIPKIPSEIKYQSHKNDPPDDKPGQIENGHIDREITYMGISILVEIYMLMKEETERQKVMENERIQEKYVFEKAEENSQIPQEIITSPLSHDTYENTVLQILKDNESIPNENISPQSVHKENIETS